MPRFDKKVIRQFLLARDKVCRYCGDPGREIEHVRPRYGRGDSNPFTNLVLSCTSCNQLKGREEGFELNDNVLTWHGRLVAPDGVYGEALMAEVLAQRIERQTEQGITHIIEHKARAHA